MEGRSESDREGDEVYSATFVDEGKKELKLDMMMIMIFHLFISPPRITSVLLDQLFPLTTHLILLKVHS